MASLSVRTRNDRPASYLRRGLYDLLRIGASTYWACLFMSPFLLAACVRADIQPVELVAEDMCESCRMAISEKRYAAEFIDQDGNALKFDDLRCAVRYLQDKNNRIAIARTFVTDFDSRQWVKAEEAYYVRSSEFRTPMNGGIVAFRDKSRAEAAADQYHGQLLSVAAVFER